LHATLCFLGWSEVGEIRPILAACQAASRSPPTGLALQDAIWLPARRPRALAVSIDDPDGALARVQSGLSNALERGGWYAPEARPFLGHVTVARVAGRARVRAVELPAPPTASLDGARVTLYRSRLERSGARYEALGP
jgi:2'-5' RNA ligase